MNVGRIFIYLFTAILVMSCSGENDTIVGNHGYHLTYIHRPSESLIAYQNDYSPNIIDTTCADLHVYVTSSLREQPGYSTPQHYSIDGDKAIEVLLANFLDPNNDKYTGDVPIPVEYRTETCKSIRITMYDKNGSFISDITESATARPECLMPIRICFVSFIKISYSESEIAISPTKNFFPNSLFRRLISRFRARISCLLNCDKSRKISASSR